MKFEREDLPVQRCLPTTMGWAHVRPHRNCDKATIDGEIAVPKLGELPWDDPERAAREFREALARIKRDGDLKSDRWDDPRADPLADIRDVVQMAGGPDR